MTTPFINAIKEYELVSEENDPEKLSGAIVKMDELGAWDFDAKVRQILGKLNIHHLNQPVKNLSGRSAKKSSTCKNIN